MRVLVIAYHFPPSYEVGAKRIAGLCRYLPEYGVSPVVLTVRKKSIEICDDSVSVPTGLDVIRTAVLTNPLQWYHERTKNRLIAPRSAKAAVATRQESSGTLRSWMRRHIFSLLRIPDRYWGWYFPAVRAAETLMRQRSISLIISSGPPWTSHLIARHLRIKFGVPWIADFRDAWTSDKWRDVPQWRDRIDRKLEASCIQWADLVLCVTNGLRSQFIERYARISPARWVTLTNGFDDDVSCRREQAPRGRRVCLHLGELYGRRRIDTFCQAMVDLVNESKLDPAAVKVLFVGRSEASFVASAREIAPHLIESGCIEFRPRVSWSEGQQLLADADVFLVFQGDHPSVPAKVYDYLRTGKPICAIVKGGDLSEMLKVTGSGVSSDPEDSRDIASKFMETLELPVRSPEEMEHLTKLYHFRSLADQLAGRVHQLVPKPTSGGQGWEAPCASIPTAKLKSGGIAAR